MGVRKGAPPMFGLEIGFFDLIVLAVSLSIPFVISEIGLALRT